jgi:hypothetical protein
VATDDQADRGTFERAVCTLEAELSNAAAHLTLDGATRRAYQLKVQAMAEELRRRARDGHLAWAEAAREAQETRNLIMQLLRARSTPIGRAVAERLKRQGPTLDALIATYTAELYGKAARFSGLSGAQRDRVYGEIVASAGRGNPKITGIVRRLSIAGRGLLVVSLATSVYAIATARDKAKAAVREALNTAAGIGGGIAGGAAAGLACGPGAPICVTVGAFVGGAAAAFGVSYLW